MVSTGNQVRDNVLFNNGVSSASSDYSNYNGPGAARPITSAFNGQIHGQRHVLRAEGPAVHETAARVRGQLVGLWDVRRNFYFKPHNERSILQVNHVTGEHRYFTLERWQDERRGCASTRGRCIWTGMVTSELSGELVQNGTFDYDLNGWSGWPSQGQMTQNHSELDNGSLKVQFSNNSTYDWFTMRQDATNAIQNGQFLPLELPASPPPCTVK